MVSERINANKPSPDVKGGKLPSGALNNNKDLDVDARREEQSFFGSFFSAAKNAQKKKGAAIMESVSVHLVSFGTKAHLSPCSPHPSFVLKLHSMSERRWRPRS